MIPTRPTNIKNINTHLLNKVKSAVIPRDNPTVPKAEVTSNKISFMENGSMADNVKTEMNTKATANNVTVTAFNKSSLYTSRLKRRMLLPPRAYVMMKITTRANVV